jgi:3-hydroxyisobutyrate dehydrogenase-like beta-hydroxyacid dehydrogenase
MVDCVGQELGRGAHNAWDIAARVNGSIPPTAAQRVKAAVTVAVDLLDVGIKAGVRLAAIEESDVMAGGNGFIYQSAAEKSSATDNQQFHRFAFELGF